MQAGTSSLIQSSRYEQVMELKTFINQKSRPNFKLIVAGDFNIDSRHSITDYNALTSVLGLKDELFSQFKQHPVTYLPWKARFNNKSIYTANLDYIFTSNVNVSISIYSTTYNTSWKGLLYKYKLEM